MMSLSRRAGVRAIWVLSMTVACAAAHAEAIFYNAENVSQNATAKAQWLTACGIQAGTYFEDFERIPLNTNLHGLAGGLLQGGLVIWDSSAAHAAYVRGDKSYFGGTNPMGTRSVAHNEQAYLELDLEANPVDYVGGYDIDHTATAIILVFVDGATASFSMDGGTVGEFWGFWRNDRPKIKRVLFDATGDGEWGLDELEFGSSYALKVTGRVDLRDFVGDATAVSTKVEVRHPGSTTPLETHSVPLAADGSYSLTTALAPGTYDLACKPTHWLRSVASSVPVTTTGATGVDFSVVNGDVDGDNAITVFDYNALSDAFDTAPGDAYWNPMADLDGDGAVTVYDYNILSANFDLAGDE